MPDEPTIPAPLAPARRKSGKPRFSERVENNFKTLLWVIPLTVLIWVYAEREQIAPPTDVSAQIEIKNSDANRLITLAPDKRQVTLTVQGPNSRVERVKEDLAAAGASAALQIEIDPSLKPGENYNINILRLIKDDPRFVSNGISVLKCLPESVPISIDQIVARDATVVAPADMPSLQSAQFTPDKVKIRGPREAMERMSRGGPLTVEADLSGLRELAIPGQHTDIPVPLQVPADDRLSLAQANVKATLIVKDPDATATLSNIPVFLLAPSLLLDSYRVKYTPILAALTVIGPPEQIKALEDGTSPYKPRAALELTSDDLKDLKNPKPKTLQYLDLPPGVRVSDTSLSQTITFTVVERG